MNDVERKPATQGWSAAWLAAKLILAAAILGVVCVAIAFAIAVVAEMAEVCPRGFHVGHFPCDVALMVCLVTLLIVGLGIWLLLWIVRLEVIWNQFQSWLARNTGK